MAAAVYAFDLFRGLPLTILTASSRSNAFAIGLVWCGVTSAVVNQRPIGVRRRRLLANFVDAASGPRAGDLLLKIDYEQ